MVVLLLLLMTRVLQVLQVLPLVSVLVLSRLMPTRWLDVLVRQNWHWKHTQRWGRTMPWHQHRPPAPQCGWTLTPTCR
jgi:hypothetical protein